MNDEPRTIAEVVPAHDGYPHEGPGCGCGPELQKTEDSGGPGVVVVHRALVTDDEPPNPGGPLIDVPPNRRATPERRAG